MEQRGGAWLGTGVEVIVFVVEVDGGVCGEGDILGGRMGGGLGS